MKKLLVVDGVEIIVGSNGMVYQVDGELFPVHLSGAEKNRRAVSIKGRGHKVYKLVMEAFTTKPETQEELHIHHVNGNSMDDRLENLVWITASEHSKIHSRQATGRHGIKIINSLTGEELYFKNKKEAAKHFGLSQNYFSRLEAYNEWLIEKSDRLSITEAEFIAQKQKTEYERKVVLINENGDELEFKTQTEMAKHFGFSRERSRQIVERGYYGEWMVSRGQQVAKPLEKVVAKPNEKRVSEKLPSPKFIVVSNETETHYFKKLKEVDSFLGGKASEYSYYKGWTIEEVPSKLKVSMADGSVKVLSIAEVEELTGKDVNYILRQGKHKKTGVVSVEEVR